MALSVKFGGVKTSYYAVEGKDLKTILASMMKKGPKEGGKRLPALTVTPIKGNLKFAVKFEKDKKKGYVAKVTVSGGSVIYSGAIKMPKLKSDKALSKKAKAEWKRFSAKLLDHEKEHVARAAKETKKIVKELAVLTLEAKGKTKKDALKAAQKAMISKVKESYADDKLRKRLLAIHESFDKESDHGVKQGAKLDTSIK